MKSNRLLPLLAIVALLAFAFLLLRKPTPPASVPQNLASSNPPAAQPSSPPPPELTSTPPANAVPSQSLPGFEHVLVTSNNVRGFQLPTNGALHVVSSNVQIYVASTPSPYRKLIGTETFEAIARTNLEEFAQFDGSGIKVIKSLLQDAGAPEDRIHTLTRLAWEYVSSAAYEEAHATAELQNLNTELASIAAAEGVSEEQREEQRKIALQAATMQREITEKGNREAREEVWASFTRILGRHDEKLFSLFSLIRPRLPVQPLPPLPKPPATPPPAQP